MKKSKIIYPMILIILLTANIFFYVWTRMACVHLGVKLSKLYKQSEELININKKLKIELLSLSSPDRIEGFAISHFNLNYPKNGQLVVKRIKK